MIPPYPTTEYDSHPQAAQRDWWRDRVLESQALARSKLHQELCAAVQEPDGECNCICQWADEIIKAAP